jgi:tetratricopeptide (TPR) repeat protein
VDATPQRVDAVDTLSVSGVTGQSPISAAALTQALTAADLAYTEPARARRLAESAVAAAPGDAEVMAAGQRALGMAAAASGDLAGAAERLRNAAEVADVAGLPVRAGEARGSLAFLLLLTSGAQRALAELDRADAILREGVSAARLQMQRGIVLTEIRHFDEARASLDRALLTLDRAGGDDLLEADIRNNRAFMCLGMRDWRGAHEELRRAEMLYARGGHIGRTARVYHNRGTVEAFRGDLPAALSAYDQAAEGYRKAGVHPGLLAVDRAEALLGVRLIAEARQAAEVAVHEFAQQRNSVDVVQARLLLAEAALLDHDSAVALIEAGRARRSARRQGRPRWAALAGYLRLQARWREGDRSTASLRAGARTAAELGEAGWVVQSLEARLILAQIALSLGRPDYARRQLAGTGSARQSGPAELRVRAWHAEAILRRSEGDRRGAARAVRAGLEILDHYQASLGATDMRAHVFAHAEELAQLGVELAVESGRPESIFVAAERGRAGALRFRPARPPDDADLVTDLAELRQVVTELRAGDVASGPLVARQQALERAIRDRARHAAGSNDAVARRPIVSQLCAALNGATLVEYLELDGDLHAVTAVANRFTFHRLGSVAAAEKLLESLRAGLRWLAHGLGSARSLAAVTGMVDRSTRELDRLLLRPVLADRDESPLVIVPTGALHAMPWSALPSCAARAVSVAPSATLWYRAATDSRIGSGRVVLAHGPGLHYASAEVSAIARVHGDTTCLTGRNAQAASVLAALDGAGVAHLAAHGHFRADNPMFSQLQFADGPLTVYDLEQLAVAPRQIVLASCDSGLASVRGGDELIGLAAALLAMGSVNLVAALIPVPDHASRALMLPFHRHLKAGGGAAEALAHARRETISAGGEGTPAVAAAAAFVCFGAG